MKTFISIGLQLGFFVLISSDLCSAKSQNSKVYTLNTNDDLSFAENVTVTLTEPIYHKRNPSRIEAPSHTEQSYIDLNYHDNIDASNTSFLDRTKTTTPTHIPFKHHIDDNFKDLAKSGEGYTDKGETFTSEQLETIGTIKHYSTTIKTLNVKDNELVIPNFEIQPNKHVTIPLLLPKDTKTIDKLKLQELTVVKEGNLLVGRVYNDHIHKFEPIIQEAIPESYKDTLKHTEL